MGADIHMYVEYFDKKKSKWCFAEAYRKGDDGGIEVPYPQRFYTGRNYELFGCLTGGKVRADIGFYFSKKLKGFPKDASPELRRLYKSWEGDSHSATWLSNKELLAFPWDRKYNGVALKEYFYNFFWKITFLDFYLPFDDRKDKIEMRLVFWFDN